MLKCFSLHNTLQGLVLLLKKVTSKPFVVSTIVLDQKDGTIIEEKVSVFDFENLASSSEESPKVVLFTISVEDAGTIVMDLF